MSRSTARRSLAVAADGNEIRTFAWTDGSLWWTDSYVAAPVPVELLGEVEPDACYTPRKGSLRPSAGDLLAKLPATIGASLAGLIPSTSAAHRVELSATPWKQEDGPDVLAVRRPDGNGYVAARFAELLDGLELLQAAEHPRTDPANTMVVGRRDGVVVALVMPLLCSSVKLVDNGEWERAADIEPGAVYGPSATPKKEHPMGDVMTSIESARDVDGGEILRGDAVRTIRHSTGIRTVAAVLTSAKGRAMVLLDDGLTVAAVDVRLAASAPKPAVGDCFECVVGHHDRCVHAEAQLGCRCAVRGHSAKEPTKQGETTMTTKPEPSPVVDVKTLTKDVLPSLTGAQLVDVAKQLGVPHSGTKDVVAGRIGDKLVELSAAEQATVKAEQEKPKAEKPKAAKESGTLTAACERCGYTFPKPRSRPVCNSEAACKARQEGGGRWPKGDSRASSGSRSSGGTKQAKADKAKASVELQRLAAEEHKAVKAWKADGSKGTPPATPNLDKLHAEYDAKEAAKKSA